MQVNRNIQRTELILAKLMHFVCSKSIALSAIYFVFCQQLNTSEQVSELSHDFIQIDIVIIITNIIAFIINFIIIIIITIIFVVNVIIVVIIIITILLLLIPSYQCSYVFSS